MHHPSSSWVTTWAMKKNKRERERDLDPETCISSFSRWILCIFLRLAQIFSERKYESQCLFIPSGRKPAVKPDRDLLNCATYGDYGDFFAKIEEKKIWYKCIYISCEEGDKNKKDECIFLNRQLRALVLKIILFFMIKSILDRSWDSEMNLRISIQE